MSRIDEKFRELEAKYEGALIGYLTLGDPDIEGSVELVKSLCKHADIVELGIPFSDPIADGPTIQAAIDRALKSGTTTEKCFEAVEGLRSEGIENPFVFMTYYNIVLQYGEESFVRRCSRAGVDGVLVSDLPVEEADSLVKLCRKYGVDMVFLIAPTTTGERLKKILKKASGFIYLVSILGTTGTRESLQEETIEKTGWALKHIKSLPLAVGFGISKPEHVRAIVEAGAQGVVVGSAFVRLVGEKGVEARAEIEKLAGELKGGTAS